MKRTFRYFACDFETTVYEGQTSTEVWASACVELGTEDVKVLHSIDETMSYLFSLNSNLICYYHNLKFDGNFILYWLMQSPIFSEALRCKNGDRTTGKWLEPEEMLNNTFTYDIADMGQWYKITIKRGGKIIEFRDSLKLMPFTLREIGQAFKTKHQKLEMEYTGLRWAGCTITDSEMEYIRNDVLVLKEALEIMFKEGHNKLTIGACCLSEYRRIIGKEDYEAMFPNLYEVPIDESVYGSKTAGDYIRHSYKGGWCYLVKGKENKIYHNGTTADVNSLYPSMMSSESKNRYPIGLPKFWSGNYIPEEALHESKYFFVRIKTRFYIKENMLPFIQIKGSMLYKGTEMLESSDVYNKKTGEHSSYYIDFNGQIHDTRLTLTLTCTDYYLLLEHYNVYEFEILDGCYFFSRVGIFDEYIEKYKKMKLENKGALRTLAKLFLNNLYGKMASSTDSSFKLAYMKDDESIGFMTIKENEKKPGYIPVGSAITSYARNFTIRTAQKNYYGVDKAGFIYADTDSIHCDLLPEQLVGVPVHDKNFCCWKLESCWDEATFTRQKTYIEHITHEDLQQIEEPYYNVKCAGMPSKCKDLFMLSMQGYEPKEDDKYNERERKFLKTKRTLSDFTIGLKVPGKLMPKRIKGGVLLVETDFEMRL